MMLSILSCVCRPSVYLLWRNVYLDLLPIASVLKKELKLKSYKALRWSLLSPQDKVQ